MRRLSLLKSDTTPSATSCADATDAELAASAPRDPAAFGTLYIVEEANNRILQVQLPPLES